MGDKPEVKSNLTMFFAKFITPLVGLISLATTLHNFVKLLSDPKEAGTLTLILLGFGILGLIGVCLYYARFWQPEEADQGIALFIPDPTGNQVKQHQRKINQRQWIRRSAVTGLITIPLLTLGGFGYWQNLQNQPSKDILILIADFKSTTEAKYLVTDAVFRNLERATALYPDVKVERFYQILTDQEARRQKASIVIWGAYGETKEKVPVFINFELPKSTDNRSNLPSEMKGMDTFLPVADLENGKFHTQLSKEMT